MNSTLLHSEQLELNNCMDFGCSKCKSVKAVWICLYFSLDCFPGVHRLCMLEEKTDQAAQLCFMFSICPGSEVIKLFSCSDQLSMKFQMLVSIKISRN